MLLAGFGYCAGTQGGICDARIAAGVSIFGYIILNVSIKHFYVLVKFMLTEMYNSQIIFRCLPSSIQLHMDLDHSSYGMITNQHHPNYSDQNNLLF